MVDSDLQVEIQVLEQHLLTEFTTDFPDTPTLQETIAINAYLVLSHGCVEEHIESLFQLHADSLSCEDDTQMVSRAVAAACFAWHDPAKSKSYRERKLSDILKSGSAHISRAAQSNHGIKESNIEKLAHAAGVEWPHFEEKCNDALIKLDTLGGKRGSVAHVSASRTQINMSPIYPTDAKSWVSDALDATEIIADYLALTRTEQ